MTELYESFCYLQINYNPQIEFLSNRIDFRSKYCGLELLFRLLSLLPLVIFSQNRDIWTAMEAPTAVGVHTHRDPVWKRVDLLQMQKRALSLLW